jgi:hypothetical protein
VRRFKIFLQIWTDLYHRHLYQSKTGVKTRLTSQIKELGAILHFWHQKLNKYEPGLIQTNEHDKHLKLVGVDGDADSLGPGVFGGGLGAATETKRKSETIGSHKN